jgi:hypothetical protein
MATRLTYEQTMAWGAQQWSDVTDRIRSAGLGRAEFTQTGGMCAAIVAGLEDGYYLLVTDAEDTLSWDRASHQGWYVGLYPPENEVSSEPITYLEDPDGSTDKLLELIRTVLRDGASAAR